MGNDFQQPSHWLNLPNELKLQLSQLPGQVLDHGLNRLDKMTAELTPNKYIFAQNETLRHLQLL